MKIEMAHVLEQGINCAIFSADARDRSKAGRRALLGQLVARARQNRLRIDKAALAFEEVGRITFFGAPDLVRFLSSRGMPRPTHTLDV